MGIENESNNTVNGKNNLDIEKGGMIDEAVNRLGGKITKAEESTNESPENSNAHVTVEDLDQLEQEVYEKEHTDPSPIADGDEFIDMNGNHYDKDGNPKEGNPPND